MIVPLLLALVAETSALRAPERPRPHMPAARASSALVLDGRLDEAAWTMVTASSGFTQKYPDDGEPPSERTTVRVLYDAESIWFGIDCEQVGSPIVARLGRRDRVWEVDRVEVDLDSRRDGVTGFRFVATAGGGLADALLFNDTSASLAWDENWEAVSHVRSDGYSVEMRIPLRALRFSRVPKQVFGVNVRRYITGRQEIDEWAYTPRTQPGVVSRFGTVGELEALETKRRPELRPFVLGRLDAIDEGYGPGHGTNLAGSAGADLRWQLADSLTLDATFNPDFGQVEADQVVLNLTNFEVAFPDKRPFFLEGLDVFAMPKAVLYTRRIGRAPGLALPEGEARTEIIEPSRILGATKLVGRFGAGFAVGSLSAVTAPNEVAVRRADGSAATRLADPLTLFNVVRVRRDMGSNGHVGFVGTATNRFEGAAAWPLADDGQVACASGARVPRGARCTRDAYVSGIDARWRSHGGEYAFAGQALASRLVRGPVTTQRDGTVFGDGAQGQAVEANLAKDGGRHWLWHAGVDWKSRHFDMNDVGFLRRQNELRLSGDLVFRTTEPWWRTRDTRTTFEWRYARNLDGLPLQAYYQLGTAWTLRDFTWTRLELHFRDRYWDDREVGDGTALERARLGGVEASIWTDPRSAVMGSFSLVAQWRENGVNASASGQIVARAWSRVELELLPSLTFTEGEPRYLGREAGPTGTSYLLGTQRATSLGATLRASVTFTPRLTLQTYAQLFLVAQRYEAFYGVSTAERKPQLALDDLEPALPPTSSRDGEQAYLNATVVLRWEWRLGSTLYVVYSRSQRPDVELERGRLPRLEVGPIWQAPAANVILVKLSYWWG